MDEFNTKQDYSKDYFGTYKLWENHGKSRIYKYEGSHNRGYIDLNTLDGYRMSSSWESSLNNDYFDKKIKILKEIKENKNVLEEGGKNTKNVVNNNDEQKEVAENGKT